MGEVTTSNEGCRPRGDDLDGVNASANTLEGVRDNCERRSIE